MQHHSFSSKLSPLSRSHVFIWIVGLICNIADCCQGKCQDETESSEDTAQAGPSGEPTGPPANDAMGESAPETSYGETSEMVGASEDILLINKLDSIINYFLCISSCHVFKL